MIAVRMLLKSWATPPGELADRLHLLRLAQFLLHPLTARQIADEAGEDAPPVDPRFSDGELDRKDLAILGDRLHEAAVADDPRFAGSHIVRHVAVVLGPVGLWHEDLDVASDNFLRTIAEEGRRRGAERGDLALLVDDDHCLGHGREDRAQVRLALGELGLRAFQAGDVVVVLQDRDVLAVG